MAKAGGSLHRCGAGGGRPAATARSVRPHASTSTPILPSFRLVATVLVLAVPLVARSALAQASPSLQVDQTEYRAACVPGKGGACTYIFKLVARYHNPTADTLYISRCMPSDPTPEYGIVPVADSTEDAAYDPIWACVGHDRPVVVAPHATRLDTLQIEGPNSWDGKTNAPLGVFEGEFKLIYKVSQCWLGRRNCRILPDEQRSQAFRVHLLR